MEELCCRSVVMQSQLVREAYWARFEKHVVDGFALILRRSKGPRFKTHYRCYKKVYCLHTGFIVYSDYIYKTITKMLFCDIIAYSSNMSGKKMRYKSIIIYSIFHQNNIELKYDIAIKESRIWNLCIKLEKSNAD